MGYLIDTNIFLEVLLNQRKKEDCKKFLLENAGRLFLTDFSLHSIGVILFREKKPQIFEKMVKKFKNAIDLVALDDPFAYGEVVKISRRYKLDFDDAYQLTVADTYGLRLVTLDKHFKRINPDLVVIL